MEKAVVSNFNSTPLRLGVGIATRGRPDVLAETLAQLDLQTRPADRIIVCHTCDADVAGVPASAGIEFVLAAPGLPRQRNKLIEAAQDCDILLFLDDDFFASPNYLRIAAEAFAADPAIVVATGMPIADGIKGPGLTPAEARRLIGGDAAERDPVASADVFDQPHGYGCNMAIRLSVARERRILFDERLPLYAWSEDVDYTHRLGRFGRIVKLARARGVHLGVKSGRSSGRNLGYSQVANPLYLRAKGSYTWGRAIRSVGRNFAANLARAAWSEPWIDRRGRLLGNVLAFADMLRGRMAPERILEL